MVYLLRLLESYFTTAITYYSNTEEKLSHSIFFIIILLSSTLLYIRIEKELKHSDNNNKK